MKTVPHAWVLRSPCGRFVAFNPSHPFKSYLVNHLSDAYLFFDPSQVGRYNFVGGAELIEVTLGGLTPPIKSDAIRSRCLKPTAWDRLLADDFVEAIQ